MTSSSERGTRTASILAAILLIAPALALSSCGDDGTTEPDQGAMFDSGNIAPGGTFSYTFQDEGTFEYYCSIHAPDMQGTITVDSAVTNPDTVDISMEGTQYVPQQETVEPGTLVLWTNNDPFNHTVTSGNPDSGTYPR